MSQCPLPIGEWLTFYQDTCFGSKSQHTGIIIATSDDELVAIPICASSQISHIEQFAIKHELNPEDTIVKLSPDSIAAASHFSKTTVFDCNRVQRISYDQLNSWHQCSKIQLADFNNLVNLDLLNEIKSKVLNSPLIDEHTKAIIRNSQN